MSLTTLRDEVAGLPNLHAEAFRRQVLALIDAEIAAEGGDAEGWIGLRARLKAWARSQQLLDTQIDELLRVAKE